jgi:putative DNA primase/helicase
MNEEDRPQVSGPERTATTIISSPSDLAGRFHTLFAGLQRAYGTYRIDQTREDGKQTGTAVTVRQPVTNELWEQHLAGVNGLGIIPIRDDNTVVFGAVDVDVYADLDHGRIASTLARMELPLIPCRSKSGGCHLFLFCKEPVPAGKVQDKLRDIAALLGHGTAEIFPKQTGGERDLGSWLNMPYQNMAETTRYAVRPGGDAMTAEEFLAAAESCKVEPNWIARPLPIAPGPAPDKTQKSKSTKSTRRAFVLPDRITEGQRDMTLASYAGTLRRAGADRYGILAALRIENEKRCLPPLPESDLERIATSIGDKKPGAEVEDGLIQRMAGAILTTDAFARDAGGLLYHFENGVYRPTGRRYVEKRVKALCEQQAPKSWTPELATRVESWIAVDAPDLWECPPPDVLNVRNGLLDIATRALRPHAPSYLSAVQIAANFDPGARCPQIDRFIADVFPEDAHHLTYEVAAWLILPNMNMQKAVLLLGEGSNGKSIWLNLMQNLLGRSNVAALTLHKLEADKFAMARLVGKLANICADLPSSALAGTSMFKALTGNDLVNAERKYESSFEFRPFARLLFSANSAPRSEDATHGFFRRWLVIPFNRTFDEMDPKTIPPEILNARLSHPEELSGMLSRALDALPTIRSGRFTESPSTRAAMDEFRRTTDPLAVWLDQNTVERRDAMIPKDKLRIAYGRACQDAGRPMLGDVQFTAALKRLRPKVQPAQRRVDGKPTRVFLGLGFLTLDPVDGGELF